MNAVSAIKTLISIPKAVMRIPVLVGAYVCYRVIKKIRKPKPVTIGVSTHRRKGCTCPPEDNE